MRIVGKPAERLLAPGGESGEVLVAARKYAVLTRSPRTYSRVAEVSLPATAGGVRRQASSDAWLMAGRDRRVGEERGEVFLEPGQALFGRSGASRVAFRRGGSPVRFEIRHRGVNARHSAEDAVPPGRRAFTKGELQRLFDQLDDQVDREYAAGTKRWLPLLRDSVAFKVCYAYGLRRRELAMLELADFGPNPHVSSYGGFGAVMVRWAKGTSGSGPRRRTVLTVQEFDWVVSVLTFWTEPGGRDQFATADRSTALWPSERGDRYGWAAWATRSRSCATRWSCRRSWACTACGIPT